MTADKPYRQATIVVPHQWGKTRISTLAAQSERGLILAEAVGEYLDGRIVAGELRWALDEYTARMAVLTAEDGAA